MGRNKGMLSISSGQHAFHSRNSGQHGDKGNELRHIGRALLLLSALPNPKLQRAIVSVFQETWQSILPQDRKKLLISTMGDEDARKVLELLSR